MTLEGKLAPVGIWGFTILNPIGRTPLIDPSVLKVRLDNLKFHSSRSQINKYMELKILWLKDGRVIIYEGQ